MDKTKTKERSFQDAPDLREKRRSKRLAAKAEDRYLRNLQKRKNSTKSSKNSVDDHKQSDITINPSNNINNASNSYSNSSSNSSNNSSNNASNSSSNSKPPHQTVPYNDHSIIVYKSRVGQCTACCKDDSRLVTISPQCKHLASYCLNCISRTIESEVSNKGITQFKCHTNGCNVEFDYSQFYLLLSKRKLNIIDKLITNKCLEKMEEFRWCKNSKGCGNGQLVSNWQDLRGYYSCHSCDTPLCFQHEIEWHNGFTCDEYQKELNKNGRFASQEILASFTKKCPNNNCGMKIAKLAGCDVMCCCMYGTHGCKINQQKFKDGCDHGGKQYCGQIFCWKCLGKIEVGRNGRGYIRHCKTSCEYAALN